ncbi:MULTISPECIES: hypothetical protein [Streptomyces]|uniref:Uncharacterized protein n=1 Tax=Streptomyces fimbriatus TaxID=68197 RepID=A0ABW0DCP4_STRFI
MTRRGQPIVFFDVDETLITAKSMVSFRNWWEVCHGGDRDWLAKLLRTATGRAEQNRASYRAFAGVPGREFLAAGRRW